jgi:small-conductance mechanosensitive channel
MSVDSLIMNHFLVSIRAVAAGLLLLASFFVHAVPSAPAEASLSLVNREVVVFRATVMGAVPEVRVKRVTERFRQLDDFALNEPLVRSSVEVDGQKGYTFSISDRLLFGVYENDLDREEKLSLEQLADRTEQRMKAVIQARIDAGRGKTILRGVAFTILASAIAVGLLWLIQRASQWVLDRLQKQVHSAREGSRLRWAEHGWMLVRRIVQLILAFLWLTVAYLWLTQVLSLFPLTQPLGDRLSNFLTHLLADFGGGLVSAIPGMVTVAIVLFLTKAINDVVANVFNNINTGRAAIPGLHQDTANATRRIVGVLIWGFGIAVAYPYLPLADSEAFKGLSVMFGFMLTLGSAGIVHQLMSGLVLIYSRALRVGDFVSVGEVMGVVKEMGVLSTKIINMRNEEVTIPNAVLVGNPIKNYTSGAGEKGALVSTKVTIGYDTPWRQVHAMLINAAEKTRGLQSTPKPFVMQKALQDFYVEYELFAHMERPLDRIPVLSELHANIQDEFNEHGVQIMSPHFVLQPKNNVVVAKENWFPEPADRP